MLVHNFYIDTVFSIKYLFEEVLDGIIKEYRSNIQNPAFTFLHHPNLEYPYCEINLSNIDFLNSNPSNYTFHRSTFSLSKKNFTVLYNKSKNIPLYLQIEHKVLSLDIIIYSESQLIALEIKNKLENAYPLNKWQFYTKYASFIELPDNLFDENDEVINRAIYTDLAMDKVYYTSPIMFEPLLKINSNSLSIDQMEGVFQNVLSVDILNEFPIYFYSDKSLTNESKTFTFKDVTIRFFNEEYFLILNNNIITDINDNRVELIKETTIYDINVMNLEGKLFEYKNFKTNFTYYKVELSFHTGVVEVSNNKLIIKNRQYDFVKSKKEKIPIYMSIVPEISSVNIKKSNYLFSYINIGELSGVDVKFTNNNIRINNDYYLYSSEKEIITDIVLTQYYHRGTNYIEKISFDILNKYDTIISKYSDYSNKSNHIFKINQYEEKNNIIHFKLPLFINKFYLILDNLKLSIDNDIISFDGYEIDKMKFSCSKETFEKYLLNGYLMVISDERT